MDRLRFTQFKCIFDGLIGFGPEHAGTILKNTSHRVLLIFGDLYPGVTCIIYLVKVRFFGLFNQDNLLPQRAEVDIVLEEYVDSSVDRSQVRS